MTNRIKFISLILSSIWFSIAFTTIAFTTTTIIFATTSFASTGGFPLENIKFTQDQASLQRGAKIYYNVCRMCHSMKYIKYKTLEEIGFNNNQIDALRNEKPKSTALSKTITDSVLNTFYGQVPPDLSLMAKARKNGPQYIYTLLTTYSEKEGVYENAVFPGIKMPDVLNIAAATNERQKEEIRNHARDVTEFLLWSSDPRAAIRKNIGIYVIVYFIILSAMLFLIMKRVWSRLDN